MVIIYEKNLVRRFFANLLDYLVIFLLTGMYIYLFGEPNDEGGYTVSGFPALFIPLLWFIYFPLCESVFNRTPWHAAFNLVVTGENGGPATLRQTLARRMTDPVELAFLGIPALISIQSTPKFQRIGDLLGKTRVLNALGECRGCQIKVTLTPREAFDKKFTCPECGLGMNDRGH